MKLRSLIKTGFTCHNVSKVRWIVLSQKSDLGNVFRLWQLKSRKKLAIISLKYHVLKISGLERFLRYLEIFYKAEAPFSLDFGRSMWPPPPQNTALILMATNIK